MYTGPKLTNNNLVFGYDTGYGIDQHSSTRHYKGEPATNLITAGIPGYFGSGGETLYKSNHYGLNSDSGVFQRNFVSNPDTGNNAGLYKNFNTAALNSSTEYIQVSFDFYMITPYVRSGQAGTGLNGYLRVQSTNGTFDNYGWDSRYSNGSGDDWNNNSAYIGQWQKVSLFVDVRDDTTPSAITAMYIYVDYAISGEGIYTNFIITEHGTLPTGPVFYTSGTRSDTASLIDLTETTDIDVSNVSFDSTGQPEFDGTNDVITTSFPATTIPTVTIEAVVYRNQATARYEAIVQNNTVSDDALYVNPSGVLMFWPCGSSSLTVPTGQWSHVAVSYNGTTLTYIVNGTTQVVTATCSHITDWDFLRIGGHGTTDGERWIGKIAVAKVYEKSLSAAELISNYNAYKNRFNI